MSYKRIFIFLEYGLLILLSVCSNSILCIMGRDLVLTPREGLQLKGKSIYYEEDSNEVSRNQTVHPWERTLKHVTFVTLFTDAAASAVAGNISKLREYTNFLASPYISKENSNPIRFGDIVTLASGRLEQTGNNSFRFIEGTCGYDCVPERVWAVWQVQKIRHRDQSQNYRYEMKFSVSPLRSPSQGRNETKYQTNTQDEGDIYVRSNALKTFIQKEDDYPQSFGRIIYPEEITFAQRRRNDENMSRNFRQVNVNSNYQQITPMTPIGQSTFMHSVFQPPPRHLSPPPERLNIGEYIKGGGSKGFGYSNASPKIEIYPHQMHPMHPMHFPTPTTYRPNYQVKIPRPNIYQPNTEIVKFPQNSNEYQIADQKLGPPLVTHHFHHHYILPGSAIDEAENQIGGVEQQQPTTPLPPNRFDKDIQSQVTPNYYNKNVYGYNSGGYYEVTTTTTTAPKQEIFDMPPAPQKISFPLTDLGEHIVEVTPPSPLKKPQMYDMYPIKIGARIPLIIFPPQTMKAMSEKRNAAKPFIQSEQFDESIRYSEPDPLYANDGSQVEAPDYNSNNYQTSSSLPSRDEKHFSSSESSEESNKEKADLVSNLSKKEIQISTPDTSESLRKEETLNSATTTRTTTTTESLATSSDNNSAQHATTPNPTTVATFVAKALPQNTHFISTSTTETPLRSLARLRNGLRTTSTTPDPSVMKWKPKRRNYHNQNKYNSQNIRREDNKAKGSVLHEEVSFPSSNDEKHNRTSPVESQMNDEIIEVLTQRSISKSVSIKIGHDGAEIPIFIDDDIVNNEVKRN